ncbi:MAG: thiamine pyrophosphate-dependent dehydrogenase E1 component subunit alpha, partial [Acidobacteriaceae bacterium]
YRTMLRIRRVEEALASRYAQQQMRCPMHLCIGQEAIAAGVCAALRPTDVVFSNHRAHGHYLAKGGNLNAMVAELHGRSTGCCGGRGGSMHLIDQKVGFLGSTPIVGGTVPLAVGAAWAVRLTNEDRVSVAFFGDGCFEEGVMHESLNFAALHRLPVVFVCENNGFSVYTPLNERQPKRAIHAVARAHGWDARATDGNDVEAVLELARDTVARARQGEGPQFLEFDTYRWREHCGPNFDDELNYRSAEEIAAGKRRCPVARTRSILTASGLLNSLQVETMERDISEEIEDAFRFALESPMPSTTAAAMKVYA